MTRRSPILRKWFVTNVVFSPTLDIGGQKMEKNSSRHTWRQRVASTKMELLCFWTSTWFRFRANTGATRPTSSAPPWRRRSSWWLQVSGPSIRKLMRCANSQTVFSMEPLISFFARSPKVSQGDAAACICEGGWPRRPLLQPSAGHWATLSLLDVDQWAECLCLWFVWLMHPGVG